MRQLVLLVRNSPRIKSPDLSFISSFSFRRYCASSSAASSKNVDSRRSLKIKSIDLRRFTPDKIRNFAIIAHIDHGKSTLSDRILEETGLISKEEQIEQYTDKLQIEKERGITVKSTTVSLIHNWNQCDYLLNLIDTPGHSDFQPEVYRSMPVCQGAILLVDATKGVQAQTISHFNRALLSDLLMIPVLNKIDVSFAKPDQVIIQMKEMFSFDRDEIFQISAKTGLNVRSLLDKICELIPPPREHDQNKCSEGFVFDSWYSKNEVGPDDGVNCLISIRNGELKLGDKIKFSSNPNKSYEIKKLAIFHPDEKRVNELHTGQIGYLSGAIHDLDQVCLGDLVRLETEAFPSDHNNESEIPKARQMVFASLFPYDAADYNNLKQAIHRIKLTDSSVQIEPDNSVALKSQGFRLGFQGLLHLDVFSQRLDYEYDSPVVITAPQVGYRVTIKGAKNIKQFGSDTIYVKNAHKLPDRSIVTKVEEPMIIGRIFCPNKYIDRVDEQMRERRGTNITTKYIDQNNVLIENRYPLQEVITDFLDELKTLTSGYASFDYEDDGYKEINVVVLTFTINKEPLDELTLIVPKSKSREMANEYCDRIKKSLKQQLYDVVIHGCINSKIICKREIKATGKDVLGGKLHGADESRKAKLVSNQEKGRERLRAVGKIQIDRSLLINVLKKN